MSMITFFAAPKPFSGHIGVIQRNAIESWKRVHADAEVILFGDEEGIAEAASDLGVRYVPNVKRNALGTPFLASIFDAAQDRARHPSLCYVNCDIILLSDFRAAAERALAFHEPFLMAGQRWDTEITALVEFSARSWEDDLRLKAKDANQQRAPRWIDYFLFSNGLYHGKIPPLVIGRAGFDNWLVWYARHSGARVLDASSVVQAIHQNHDYSHHAGGATSVYHGAEAQQNFAHLDGGRRHATMSNATHRFTQSGLRSNWYHYIDRSWRRAWGFFPSFGFLLLDITRPVRRRLGLIQAKASELSANKKGS